MTPDDASYIDIFVRIAREFGFPVVVLILVLWMLREASRALHNSVLIPAVTSHTEFLKTTQETLKTLSVTQQKQADAADAQADAMHEIARGQAKILEVVTGGERARG